MRGKLTNSRHDSNTIPKDFDLERSSSLGSDWNTLPQNKREGEGERKMEKVETTATTKVVVVLHYRSSVKRKFKSFL